MTAKTNTGFSRFNCCGAAACSCHARIIQVDTALDVVVSICAFCVSGIECRKART
ncbi:MAG: hypothetical protein IKU68_05755 [Oscillospiraceae bacterium]|nr:hypothetical protein [Oscillospiraceae bacterium]